MVLDISVKQKQEAFFSLQLTHTIESDEYHVGSFSSLYDKVLSIRREIIQTCCSFEHSDSQQTHDSCGS